MAGSADIRTTPAGRGISVELTLEVQNATYGELGQAPWTGSGTSTNGCQPCMGVIVGRLAEMASPDDWPRSRRCTHGATYSRAHCALARAASAREIGAPAGRGSAQLVSGGVNPSAVNAFSATRR